MIPNTDISNAMTIQLAQIFGELPKMPEFVQGIRRAPRRTLTLTRRETELALKNALRYIPERWHKELAPEFIRELMTTGRIYGYRFRPEGRIGQGVCPRYSHSNAGFQRGCPECHQTS